VALAIVEADPVAHVIRQVHLLGCRSVAWVRGGLGFGGGRAQAGETGTGGRGVCLRDEEGGCWRGRSRSGLGPQKGVSCGLPGTSTRAPGGGAVWRTAEPAPVQKDASAFL
jgi:hypothetical protein